MTFVGALSSDRALRLLSEEEKAGGKKQANHGVGAAVALDEFRGLHVAEKVLRQHGASFAPAVAEMEAIEARVAGMDELRAKPVGRALEAFYAKVGANLADTPVADRPKAVKAAVTEARTLVEQIAYDELVAPALAAMSDLLGYGKNVPGVGKAARAAILELLELTDGRAGATSVLNVYPNIVWHIEDSAPLARPAERFARWGAIARAIAEVLPRAKLDQVDVTNLATRITLELEQKPKDHQGALERAAQSLKEASAGLYQPLRAQLEVQPKGAGPETPAGAAWAAIRAGIVAVAEANPTGPASLSESLAALLAATTAQLGGVNADRQRGWEAIGAALQAGARTSSVEALVQYFTAQAPNLVANRAAVAELAAGDQPLALPSAILKAASATMGLDVNRQDLKPGLTRLLELRPTAALQGAITVATQLGRGAEPASLLWATTQFAATSPVSGAPALQNFVERFTTILPELRPQLGDAKALPAAYAIARANLVEPLSADRAQQIAELCRQISQSAPDAPLPELIGDDANKRPGIITLSKTENLRWQAPVQYLVQLLPQLAAVNLPASAKMALTRHAMSIAHEVAKLDRDPATIWGRVTQDWQSALGQPNALHFGIRAGKAVDVRANLGGLEDGAAVRFLREHAVLPPELAFTASIRLSPEQLGWLRDFLATERSRMQGRNVRDAIYTCIDVNRLDFIEALRTTKAPRGVVARLTTFVAAEMRGGRAKAIPFDALIKGLAKGEDPLPAIERERLGGGPGAVQQPGAVDAVAVMDLMGMGAVKADPETIASMKRALPDLQALLGSFPAGGQVQGAPSSNYRDPILACLQSMVDGTWPAIKYDNEAGRRALEGLTPEQKAIWMDEWVTPLNEQAGAPLPEVRPAVAKNPAALADAMVLVRGLAKALPVETKLSVPGMPELAFDQASAERLRAEVEAVREKIHGAKKGTAKHRELSTKIGPLSANLAVIELGLALEAVVKGGEGDPAKTIAELVPLLEAAVSATRKLGGRGSSEAIKRVLEVAPEPPQPVKRNPRRGIYAADEDNLEAWVTSFDAGCIASKAGQNRMSQAEFISGAQYKMLRVCSDNNGVTRSMFRLYKVEMPGYKGHAIWMDAPMHVGRGQNPTDQMYALAYRHGLKKAMAMGVPFMFGSPYGNQAAQAAGLPVQDLQVQMSIDRGNTGLHHCQGIQGGHYFVAWPVAQGCGYQNATDASNTYDQAYHFSVVRPR